MRILRRHGFLKPAALLLATVLFIAQAFACCQANARMGRNLVSLFTRTSQPAHACCAKANPSAPPAESDCARKCCIQAAPQHAPQLASVASDLPQFSAPAFLLQLPSMEPSATLGERTHLAIGSGPPLYLRTLRLLV